MATRRVGLAERSGGSARAKAKSGEILEPAAPAAAVPARAGRSTRRTIASDPSPISHGPSSTEASSGLGSASASAMASVVTLEPGLNVLEITGPPVVASSDNEAPIPLIRVSEWPTPGSERLTILSETGVGDVWIERSGGVVVVRTPAGGGRVAVTVFGAADEAVRPAAVAVRRLAGGEARIEPADPAQPALSALSSDLPGRDVTVEILMHIEREGDRQFPGQGWVGPRGQKRRVEAFGIRPLGGLWPRDIHYKALQAGGVETPWTPGPQLCGTRGRGMPLLGFAIRVAPHLQAKFDVIYQGAFFNSGVAAPARNGEPCRPPIAGDPLEAMSIRIIERASE
jgi:hypothetical protein